MIPDNTINTPSFPIASDFPNVVHSKLGPVQGRFLQLFFVFHSSKILLSAASILKLDFFLMGSTNIERGLTCTVKGCICIFRVENDPIE